MEKNVIIVGLVMLVIGLGIGYFVGSQNSVPAGMHVMSDGSVMSDESGMSMANSMEGMMHGLASKTGDAFDQAFLEEMIVHHEGAVMMAEALLQNTKRPELQKLGNDIISAQTGEIGMMKQWLREWFGN
jgi:uncharacterized protein (DUF305 family)